jgi:hypothetical protein
LEDLKLMRKQVSSRPEAIPADVSVADHFHQQLTMLNEQIEDTKHAIADHLKQYPDLKQQTELLKTIPGISLQTIAKLIAECRDLGAFRAPRIVGCFCWFESTATSVRNFGGEANNNLACWPSILARSTLHACRQCVATQSHYSCLW